MGRFIKKDNSLLQIMPRSQNALAIVNAAFSVKFDGDLIESISVVYGNISTNFNHAVNTEAYLKGKNLFNNQVVQGAINMLNKEIVPVEKPPAQSSWARKKLAIGLFYKVGLLMLELMMIDGWVIRKEPWSHEPRVVKRGSWRHLSSGHIFRLRRS